MESAAGIATTFPFPVALEKRDEPLNVLLGPEEETGRRMELWARRALSPQDMPERRLRHSEQQASVSSRDDL
jgi:hypothetical protein